MPPAGESTVDNAADALTVAMDKIMSGHAVWKL
jgi:hypothetical protein